MSNLGPLTFGKKEEQIFLGREINQHRDFSEQTAIQIDQEVRTIVQNGYDLATKVLTDDRETLVRIAEALLEREILDANEIKLLIDGKPLPEPVAPPAVRPPEDGKQQVLKPEAKPGVRGLAEGERPAPA
jgi:cell division protease FtsH